MIDSQTYRQQGERLKSIRKDLNLSQETFANKLGVTQGHLSAMERGVRALSYKITSDLAKLIPEINVDWLMHGRGSRFLSNDAARKIISDPYQNIDKLSSVAEYAPDKSIDPSTEYQIILMERIARLELFIKQKFPDFPLEKLR